MDKDKKEQIMFPSDAEEREAVNSGVNYTKLRSKNTRIYSDEELLEFKRSHPESWFPFSMWIMERSWKWLINSKGCEVKWYGRAMY